MAHLHDARLAGAKLLQANLDNAILDQADLGSVTYWKMIAGIRRASISDLENPPDGFVEWAKEHGAVADT